MREINKTEEIKMTKIETLVMEYDSQNEFELHCEELYEQGWSRDIYSQIYNWETGRHEYVLYTKEIDMTQQ